MSDILEFSGPNRILSNMAAARVRWGDALTSERDWPCSEVPYFLARTSDPQKRDIIMSTAKSTYSGLKSNGKSHAESVEITCKIIKKSWRSIGPGEADETRKISIMQALVFDKIGRNSNVQETILNTKTGLIQEGNKFGDTFWGIALNDVPSKNVKKGEGQNMLGKIFMEARNMLHEHGPQHLLDVSAKMREKLFVPPTALKSSQRSFQRNDLEDYVR